MDSSCIGVETALVRKAHNRSRRKSQCKAELTLAPRLYSHPLIIAKRTKSKNRMQITELFARLGQHERVLREIQGIWAKFSFHKCFRNTIFCPLRNLQNHPPLPVCLSESCLSHDVTRALRYCDKSYSTVKS